MIACTKHQLLAVINSVLSGSNWLILASELSSRTTDNLCSNNTETRQMTNVVQMYQFTELWQQDYILNSIFSKWMKKLRKFDQVVSSKTYWQWSRIPKRFWVVKKRTLLNNILYFLKQDLINNLYYYKYFSSLKNK